MSGQIDLGGALRALRERAGFTQGELAVRADLDAPHVSRVETGAYDVRWSTVTRLLAALDADLCELQDALKQSGATPPDNPGSV